MYFILKNNDHCSMCVGVFTQKTPGSELTRIPGQKWPAFRVKNDPHSGSKMTRIPGRR